MLSKDEDDNSFTFKRIDNFETVDNSNIESTKQRGRIREINLDSINPSKERNGLSQF